jgi:PD-(D/E)XK nuclease superfamily
MSRRTASFLQSRCHRVAEGRTGLALIWLEHLLLLSMLQHAGGIWSWGRYISVRPASNVDYVEACETYRSLLADEATFGSMTLEELANAGVLPAASRLRDRYLLA